MSESPSIERGAAALLRGLSADEVRALLDDLEAERAALRALLRSLLARERVQARQGRLTDAPT
jgi:hypothetical protein